MRTAGAVGRYPMKTREVETELAKAEENEVQRLARKHTASAVAALAKIMKGKDTAAGAKVSAARAILDYGWGKPASQDERALRHGPEGITINIVRLSDDRETVTVRRVQEGEAVDAEAILEETVAGED
jgi:hypothetical protein